MPNILQERGVITMAKINLLNEKGNVRPKVRDSVKAQIGQMLKSATADKFLMDTTKTAGTYVIEVGTVESTNEPIYATVSVGVSTIHPDTKRKSSKSVKTVDEVEVPTLF
jgi:hypothetical protein